MSLWTEYPVPHFELSTALWAALDYTEVNATIAALSECNELALPYDEMTIRYSVEAMAASPGWGRAPPDPALQVYLTVFYNTRKMGWTPEMTSVSACVIAMVEQEIDGATMPTIMLDLETAKGRTLDGRALVAGQNRPELLKYWLYSTNYAARMLVAALATKNVVKTTAVNKRAARGHGSGGKFRGPGGMIRTSFTMLDVPEEYTSTGKRVKFHLRRGHYHHFRTGKNFEGPMIRKYLPAMLVNKDLQAGAAALPSYEVSP